MTTQELRRLLEPAFVDPHGEPIPGIPWRLEPRDHCAAETTTVGTDGAPA